MKTVLVTGGAGYIGSILVRKLLDNNYKVKIIDRFFFVDENTLPKNSNLIIIKDDIRRINKNEFENVDIVIDLVNLSIAPHNDSFFDKYTWEINHDSRVTNAKNSKECGVKQYLLASSCSVYGFTEDNIICNEKSEVNPQSTYAKAKVATESEVIKLANEDFMVNCLRFPTVIGYSPRMRFDIIVNSMVYDCYSEKKIRVLKDGKQRRSFVHIDDVANSYLFFMNYAKQKEINGEIYNVGDERNNINMIDLAKLIMKELKLKENIEWFGDNPDDRSYFVSFEKIKSIGFEAKYTIQDGVHDVHNKLLSGRLEKTEDTNSINWFQKLELWKKIIYSKAMYDGILEIE